MRVLQLSKFYPPVPGGIESVVFELTEGLNRSGTRTDVLCAHQQAGTRREHWPDGYEVMRAASFGQLMSTSIAPMMIAQLAAMAKHYDLIHVHLPDPLANLALWCARPRAAIVVHWHSDIIQQRIALKLYRPLQDWLLRRADAIVATSEPYWRASPSLPRFAAKIRAIPIGISDLEAAPGPQQVAAIRQRFGHRRIVFALGRMVYYKGFDRLIDVARALPQDTVVVIGGAGPLSGHLHERVTAEGLQDKVFLPGRIPDAEIPAYFEAAELFCLPSDARAEAFGVVLLEAMRAGRPIVASAIPGSGVPWVNRHESTGLNYPTGDRDALAAALNTLLADDTMARRYGSAGRHRFLERFTSEQMVRATTHLYAELLQRRPAHSPAAGG